MVLKLNFSNFVEYYEEDIENIQKILVDKDIIPVHQSVPQKKKEKHL